MKTNLIGYSRNGAGSVGDPSAEPERPAHHRDRKGVNMALGAADRNEDAAHSDAVRKRSRKRKRPQLGAQEPAHLRIFNGDVFSPLPSRNRKGAVLSILPYLLRDPERERLIGSLQRKLPESTSL